MLKQNLIVLNTHKNGMVHVPSCFVKHIEYFSWCKLPAFELHSYFAKNQRRILYNTFKSTYFKQISPDVVDLH